MSPSDAPAKVCQDYALAGISRGWTQYDGYYVMRDGRWIASFQTGREQAMFAEELYERIAALRKQPTVETSAAPKVIEETCSWCSGVGQIGTPGTSCSFCNGEGVRRRDTENTGTAPKIKRGDRVRVALSADNVIPTDGWIVDRLPTREWSCYGLTHENGGTMSINMDLVTLADPATQF